MPQQLIKLSLVLSLFFNLSCSRSAESGLNPGDSPPAFELQDLQGNKHTLAEFAGKVVLLNFWATWCGPCIAELPSLNALNKRLDGKKFAVVAIGIDDDAGKFAEFAKEYKINFLILVDKTGEVKKRYKVSGVPESFIVGSDGKLVLFNDFESAMPAVRIMGPREWNSSDAFLKISELLP